jgi:hypothetical protein
VTSVASLPAVAFVFADASLGTDTSIFAALAWSLAVTALLALAAALAAWLAREILLVDAKLMLEVQRRIRSLA